METMTKQRLEKILQHRYFERPIIHHCNDYWFRVSFYIGTMKWIVYREFHTNGKIVFEY